MHSVTVALEAKKAKYRVVSTILLSMNSTNPETYGDLEMASTLTRSSEESVLIDAKGATDTFNLSNIGKLLEANETAMRMEMDGIYIGKTKQIINTGRLKEEYMTNDEKRNFQDELAQKTVEFSSGGGMVTAVARGDGTLADVRIDAKVVDPEDVDMLQDLVLSAVNGALTEAKETASKEMAKVTSGLGLPGM